MVKKYLLKKNKKRFTNKAFTLIELISVIIIMGIIALITIPIIKDIINSSREKNFKHSALGLIEAANQYYLNSKLTNDSFDEITFKVNNGKMVSEDRELAFNGSVPIGDSYVKIKANGDIAINITDGEFYAVKDYDEVGVSTGTSEENALLREELSQKIIELENKLDSTKSELQTSISTSKEELNNKININTSSINNLTNKDDDNNIFLQTYPVGSIYISTSDTNPATIYGGTWIRFGEGKTLVGVNESETEFATVNKTGGEKTHTLTIEEMPSHNHTQVRPWVGYEGWNTMTLSFNEYGYVLDYTLSVNSNAKDYTGNASINNITRTGYTGSSQSHNNLQPYITVYMFKRTN